MINNNFCVIMAGGIGSRFWPLSREKRPKQFLDILGTGQSFLQQTFSRFEGICPVENIFIVTNSIYKDIILDQLPNLPEENVLLEPLRRNTAPCIAYANQKIKLKNPNANIIVAPSDHLIIDETKFRNILLKGLDFVNNNHALLTLGIKPNRPETGYGYIQFKKNSTKTATDKYQIRMVKTFTEKPNKEMAKIFFESGEFIWNSGIFLWSLKSISSAFEKYLPEVNDLFNAGSGKYNSNGEQEFINETYSECKNISIDIGILEKADNVYVLEADFGWSDLGTWGSLYGNSEKDENKNALVGKNIFLYDTQNCIVNMPKEKLVVIQGLKDFIVVESDGVLLICKKENEQNIRNFVNDIRISRGEDFV